MIDLPQEMRDMLVEQLDEYLEGIEDEVDPEDLAQYVVDSVCEAAQESEVEQADDIIGLLENSGDLDASLLDMLTEQFEQHDLESIVAEDILGTLEKICEIEWGDEDDEMFGVDEMGEELGYDEGDEY